MLSVVLAAHKTAAAVQNDLRYSEAAGLLAGAADIVRAAGAQVPRSASQGFLNGKHPEAFVAWCRAKYPSAYRNGYNAGVAVARSH